VKVIIAILVLVVVSIAVNFAMSKPRPGKSAAGLTG
jgi:lipopolysaccharide export LptBFGC system permease protein LptF